jgi:hypothetical protein
MTLPSRKLAAMFFCVFVLGAVAGGLLVYDLSPMRFADFLNRTTDPDYIAQRVDKKLAAQYHLDADEQARIAPATRELGQRLFQIRQKFASDVLAALDVSHAKIAAQMTPQQRDAYLNDMAVKRQQHVIMLMPPGSPAASARH